MRPSIQSRNLLRHACGETGYLCWSAPEWSLRHCVHAMAHGLRIHRRGRLCGPVAIKRVIVDLQDICFHSEYSLILRQNTYEMNLASVLDKVLVFDTKCTFLAKRDVFEPKTISLS